MPRQITMVAYNAEGEASAPVTEPVPLTPASNPNFSVCIADVTKGSPCLDADTRATRSVHDQHRGQAPIRVDRRLDRRRQPDCRLRNRGGPAEHGDGHLPRRHEDRPVRRTVADRQLVHRSRQRWPVDQLDLAGHSSNNGRRLVSGSSHKVTAKSAGEGNQSDVRGRPVVILGATGLESSGHADAPVQRSARRRVPVARLRGLLGADRQRVGAGPRAGRASGPNVLAHTEAASDAVRRSEDCRSDPAPSGHAAERRSRPPNCPLPPATTATKTYAAPTVATRS